MKAEAIGLLKFLLIGKQCVIPTYQRTYSWMQSQCDLLWEDILRTGSNKSIPSHFVGSIVHIQEDNHLYSAVPQSLVIDGQQRMTTISLLLLALANHLSEKQAVINVGDDESVSDNYIKNNYLFNANEQGDKRYKLILTRSDKETFFNLLNNTPDTNNVSTRIKENYDLFKSKLEKTDLKTLYDGLHKLMVVEIGLDRAHDNPQLIFESLNSTGLELSQSDLIRNFILMGLEPKKQEDLYEKYWFPIESDFRKNEDYFDRFMRDYLTIKLGRIPNIKKVYDEFKFYFNANFIGKVEESVNDIYKYSKFYVSMILNKESDHDLLEKFKNINELRIEVVYPFLLEVYKDYEDKVLDKKDFISILDIIESYAFRRVVCEIPTNSLNKTFALLYRDVDKANYLESVTASLLLKDSYRRFPSDKEFLEKLQTKDFYNFNRKKYLFRRLENFHLPKERVSFDKLSVEHILPQNQNLNEVWKSDLGENWREIQKELLHSLGNLTLTGYNSELSDHSFKEKRDAEGGFKQSKLSLNDSLANLEIWNENEIMTRSQLLSKNALEVWKYQYIDELVLEKYKKVDIKADEIIYTFDDHPYIKESHQDIFNQIKKKILNIDVGISEKINKRYIAYRTKDRSNFVCITPYRSALNINLSIKFDELNDPNLRCRDVSSIGHYGTGSSEIELRSESEIDYVMNLIKQAYDYSMIDE